MAVLVMVLEARFVRVGVDVDFAAVLVLMVVFDVFVAVVGVGV